MSNDAGSRLFGSLVASGVAEVVTLPIDVAKVRLQVQTSTGGSQSIEYRGMFDCLRKIQTHEGTPALWKGLYPALVRQCLYSSCSLVLYEPVRDFVVKSTGGANSDGSVSYTQRLWSGGLAGAISITIFNWTEVLKTRMQTSSESLAVRAVISQVYRADGLLGFWAGIKPNVMRTFLVNAAELGTYDQAKTMLVPHLGDNLFAHLGASTVSGVCSALVSTPSDVIKTRLMNAAGQATATKYNGVADAFVKIYRNEGFGALYKGFVPICARKVVWCSTFFVLYEQLRAVANKKSEH
uniref:Mitochondrial carrier protein n=1 Tax=Mucochytrium quahogii TaxID=96639 RepID=A0A7S2W7F8_9STRA|mmetsp:Transcript_9368/g.15281  ORF Transcript_9368/g.15281 Transcript_9368/m.15281 type:complete len:295 (-) Transcript_9368:814-1698(-)